MENPNPSDIKNPALEKEKKKKRPRGFASVIDSQLTPLNTSDYFKEKYGQDSFKMLLIATDDKHAAFVTVNEGSVVIEDVKNEKEELKILKPNGKIQTDTETFLGFAMGKVNPLSAILSGKLRIKGIRTVLRFTKYFGVLAYIQKQQKTPKPVDVN